MKVGDSVRLAISDWERGELESATLHACNAVDGTAKKVYPNLQNKMRFTRFLRENYDILGPMAAPGIDLAETRFPIVVKRPTALGGKPDFADLIYSIHRCGHGHGDELPDGFQLISDSVSLLPFTTMQISKGKVRISDRTIFGLVAVSVLCPVSTGQCVPGGYYLTFGRSAKLMINEWWGRATDFPQITALEPMPKVKLNFNAWENEDL